MLKQCRLSGLVILAIAALACAFSGGNGTAANPYQISTREHLESVSSDPNAYYSSSYILVNDIDLAGITYLEPLIAPDTSTSNGFQGAKFTGSFNGNGFAINNLTISTTDSECVGLFGYIGSGAVIANLSVNNVNITGGKNIAGLVGRNDYGTINACYSTGTVAATGCSGGLVGYNYYGTISQSASTCGVTGGNAVGGLIGDNRYGIISLCYSTGAISGTDRYVGGLLGLSSGGTVSFCYSTGTVHGTGNSIGGLMGMNSGGQLTSCYSTGAVNGANKVGGLAGENYGTVSFCYTTGAVTGNTEVGGLFGYNAKSTTVSSCFWDIQTSGQTSSAGGKGLSTAQMKTMSIFANAGWAGKGWVTDEGNDYPHLEFEQTGGVAIADAPPFPVAGKGTAQQPYLIYTPQEFALLSWYYDILDTHILLMNDIDMTGVLLYPIGDLGAFNGIFDGNGKTVNNAVINNPGSNWVGIFGSIGIGGQVKNLGIESVFITGNNNVGGLAGDNWGTVTSCHSTGSVNGNSYVGGLVGYDYSGTVDNCYSTGSVNATGDYVGGLAGYVYGGNMTRCYSACSVSGTGNYIGGLVGYVKENATIVCCYSTGSAIGNGRVGGLIGYRLHGTLRYCYSTAPTTGIQYVGGLIGEDYGTLKYCYSTGFVSGTSNVGGLLGSAMYSTIYSSYWDKETSGRTSSAGGTLKTTAQMKTKATYTGWNFQNLFTIEETVTYPTFRDLQSYSLPQNVELTELTGSGTISDPYIITNADELNAVRKDLNAYYRLGNDIDLSNSIIWNDFLGWQPIGEATNGFKGTFDGDGYVIRNLTISSGASYYGLFGYIDSGAVIKNLGIENAVIIGFSNVGGLAGCNAGGTIRNSYVTGFVYGTGSSTGGLVGENKLSGAIISCYSAAAVGTSSSGGLVGKNTAAILYSFWDMEASGRTASAGGTGKTTAEMKTQATYAGWNFNLLWKIDEGITYPTIRSTSIYSLPQNIELSELAGNGTSNSPYIITNADQLNAVRKNFNAHYRMSNDIDLIDSFVWNNSSGWEPIGTLNDDFKGTFDGNGYVVRNITISTGADYTGMFGCLGSTAVVKNLGIEDITITGNNYAGGLAGLSSGKVSNCYSIGYTTGNNNIGGLIGHNSSGNISDCYTAGSISGNGYVGGLVGYNLSGNILESSSTTSVSGGYNGGQNTGGLVGCNSAGYISDCYTAGSVSGVVNIGGLVGYNASGTAVNCYSTSLVSGGNNTGGLIGTTSAGLVGYCYFTGSVNAGTYVGGLVGSNSGGTIAYSYSAGLVQAASIYAGGLVGTSSGAVYFSFWDIETSGQTTSSGGTGKTTVEMMTKTTYTGWNFAGLWEISDSEGYPTLSGTQIYSQPQDIQIYQLAGNGSAAYPFIITNADELNAVRQSLNAHYRLANDIELIDSVVWNNFLGWQPIGTESAKFNGTFDGNGFVIKNLTISRSSDYVGLFGYTGSSAVIKNLGVENVAVIGKQYVGGLVGHNDYGTISRCYSTGLVSGSSHIGGLVGTNNYGKVQYCYSTSSANGKETGPVGGLVGGNNYGTIKYCYSTGAVSGSYNLGGLVGSSSSSYFTKYSFWDTVTSGQTISSGGTGKTTVQMKMQATYTGWNFNALWTINEGATYPELRSVSNYSLPRNVQLSQLSGGGTIGNPYIITNADELNAVRKDLNAHYRLGNDIDLIDSAVWDNFQGWQPIGTYNTGFKGTLDGNGFAINNISISRESDYIGLFGSISESSVIKNVSIKNAVIAGLSYAGALVGYNFGTIRLCCSTGQIIGNDYIGGLIGQNESQSYVHNCYSSVAVSGRSHIGGLIGCQNSSSNASLCYSTGSVSGNDNVGGLVGYNFGSSFSFCYWDTESSGKATSALGTGKTTAQMKMRSTYENWNFALWTIDEGVSYPTLIDIKNYSLPRDVQLSELAGNGTFDAPYILTNADELNAIRKDLNAHYRLGNDIDLIDSVIWNNFAGWEPIGTQFVNFNGTFDGNGFAIINLNIDRYNTYVGLFGYLGINSGVKDLGIVNATINGNSGVGCLAGYNRGTISRCYSIGSVRGFSAIGGLVGTNAYGSIIHCYSSGTVNAFAQTSGGLIGANSGAVTYCYSKCSTYSDKYSGGLIGSNYGTVSSCYSAGAVSGVLNYGGLIANNLGNTSLCFWDTETSLQTHSQGGLGQTTAQMQTQSTFITAGWDFVNEDINGQMQVWYMPIDDYPLLYWQAAKGDVNYDGNLNEFDLRVMISQWLMAAQENQRLCADIDDNGIVDFADFSILSYALIYIGADFNRDGIVDEHDLVILASDWLAQGQQLGGDINNDGSIDLIDFAILADAWLTDSN